MQHRAWKLVALVSLIVALQAGEIFSVKPRSVYTIAPLEAGGILECMNQFTKQWYTVGSLCEDLNVYEPSTKTTCRVSVAAQYIREHA